MKNSLLITLILLVTLATNTSTGYCQQPNPSTASPDTSGPDAHALKIYSDTKRIDAGYMEKSLIGNTRHNPHTSKIISLAAIAGLAVVLGVVVHGIR